ncbi:hypothetical protein DERP_005024 [Dermatophagoides pteronyssinus]|uniref:Uncharacterized protein n=1 Tax=Dermatophagoides pteronyssinus TaxID=6956 RepID=A0ABQ8JT98_DERPT|nr:hypothetical protein DERP_005024 [Dermatophagoides pteronyssinus]
MAATVKYRPCRGSHAAIKFFGSNNCFVNSALYGSTMVSETLVDGSTLNDVNIRSGNSSRIRDIINVPIPEPVPPPNECDN